MNSFRILEIKKSVWEGNDREASLLRGELERKGVFLLNLMSSPGSGKTTTLHSALGAINTLDTKIWTAEDPVEITQPGLRQLQVHPKIGLTFASALRSFLRQDPDVIMVGEMRDKETVEAAISAAQSFVRMPPVPRLEPAPPARLRISSVISAT